MTKQRTIHYAHRLTIRLTQKEQQRLEKLLGQNAYCRNMSELLRDMLFKKELTIKTYDASREKLYEELAGVRKELRSIGVNINQVARFFNAAGDDERKKFYALKIAPACEKVLELTEEIFAILDKLSKKWSPGS